MVQSEFTNLFCRVNFGRIGYPPSPHRRNLTDEQRTYLLGKMYEARKHTRGGSGANRYTILQKAQIEPSVNVQSGTIKEQIAHEQGVGHATVARAEHYARGIDAIREEDSDICKSKYLIIDMV